MKWGYFLGKVHELKEDDLERLKEGDKIIEKALDFYEQFGQDERLRSIYISQVESERFNRTKIQEAEERGIDIGREEGRKEGIDSTILSFKKIGIPIEKISQATGLSEEEIMNITED